MSRSGVQVAHDGAEAHAPREHLPPGDGRTTGSRRSRAGAVKQLWAPGWSERHQFHPHLSAMPVFAGCTRRQIRRIARWGDVIEVHSGEVLAREDRSDYWFFVILAGSVKVTHRRRQIATLQRGGHFGEIAVIGYRPQPATVTAAEPTVLFVLSRRHFVSLAATDRSIQRAIFPDVPADGYRGFVRDLHLEGRKEWERIKPQPEADPQALIPQLRPPSGRRITLAEAVEALTRRDVRTDLPVATLIPELPPRAIPRSWRVAIAVVLAVVLAVGAAAYHPPFAVLTPSRPIDVVPDITITGMKVDPPTGRYLLTAVHVSRPNVAGTFIAWATGGEVVRVRSSTIELDETEARREREAFRQSHRQAIALAERLVGADPKGLTIVIRDRGIAGPSAGLTYALAIIDMLDPADLAGGRVIAATGELQKNGRISTVGLVAMKLDVAREGGADIFLVPFQQADEARDDGVVVVGVKDLEAAVRALTRQAAAATPGS